MERKKVRSSGYLQKEEEEKVANKTTTSHIETTL